MKNPRFDKNPRIVQAIDKVYNHVKEKEYGNQISWDTLKSYTGINDLSKDKLYYIMQKVNDLLLSDSKYMETICGFGKKILRPEEHTLSARKKIKKSVRIYKQSGHILAATNMDMLDDQQKSIVIDEAKKWSTLEHIHTELLKKKSGNIEDKTKANQMVFDLISYLKN